MLQDTEILLDSNNLLSFQFHELILVHNSVFLAGGQLAFTRKSTLIAQIEQRLWVRCFPMFRNPWAPWGATLFHLNITIQSMGYCIADNGIAIFLQCFNFGLNPGYGLVYFIALFIKEYSNLSLFVIAREQDLYID